MLVIVTPEGFLWPTVFDDTSTSRKPRCDSSSLWSGKLLAVSMSEVSSILRTGLLK